MDFGRFTMDAKLVRYFAVASLMCTIGNPAQEPLAYMGSVQYIIPHMIIVILYTLIDHQTRDDPTPLSSFKQLSIVCVTLAAYITRPYQEAACGILFMPRFSTFPGAFSAGLYSFLAVESYDDVIVEAPNVDPATEAKKKKLLMQAFRRPAMNVLWIQGHAAIDLYRRLFSLFTDFKTFGPSFKNLTADVLLLAL